MLDFFTEGGFAMWLILALGVVLLAASVRFAIRPDRAHVGLLVALGIAVAAASLQGMLMDMGSVFSFLARSGAELEREKQFTLVLMQGLKESTRPGTFGGGILVLCCIAIAIGAARYPRRQA